MKIFSIISIIFILIILSSCTVNLSSNPNVNTKPYDDVVLEVKNPKGTIYTDSYLLSISEDVDFYNIETQKTRQGFGNNKYNDHCDSDECFKNSRREFIFDSLRSFENEFPKFQDELNKKKI